MKEMTPALLSDAYSMLLRAAPELISTMCQGMSICVTNPAVIAVVALWLELGEKSTSSAAGEDDCRFSKGP